jgi:hypothetical protein
MPFATAIVGHPVMVTSHICHNNMTGISLYGRASFSDTFGGTQPVYCNSPYLFNSVSKARHSSNCFAPGLYDCMLAAELSNLEARWSRVIKTASASEDCMCKDPTWRFHVTVSSYRQDIESLPEGLLMPTAAIGSHALTVTTSRR